MEGGGGDPFENRWARVFSTAFSAYGTFSCPAVFERVLTRRTTPPKCKIQKRKFKTNSKNEIGFLKNWLLKIEFCSLTYRFASSTFFATLRKLLKKFASQFLKVREILSEYFLEKILFRFRFIFSPTELFH